MTNKYSSATDLKKAFDSGEVLRANAAGFCCKGELFIHDDGGKPLYSRYCGTYQSCCDICELLGLDAPEEV